MIKHCKGARSRYEDSLKESKAAKEKEQLLSKCRAIMEDIGILKRKKKSVEDTIKGLGAEADALYIQAENEHNFTFVTKANAFKKAQKKKQKNNRSTQFKQ